MRRFILTSASIIALAAGSGAFAAGSTSPPSGSSFDTPANHQAAKPMDDQTPAMQEGSGATSGSSSSDSAASSTAGDSGGMTASASDDQLRSAQQKLKEAGLYKGTVDGRNGPATRRALTAYQRQNGLKTTASLDDQTRQKLGLDTGTPSSGSSDSSSTGGADHSPSHGMSNGAGYGGSAAGQTGSTANHGQ